jgi:hypothetical protein
MDFVISHPRVVSASLDHFNQTITLVGQGSGDSNIVIYMADRPQIFDIIRVRVSSIVKPLSPVSLHLGGEVEFRVANTDQKIIKTSVDARPRWTSSNPVVLQIDLNSGKSKALGEGTANVLLSNHLSAASIVNVSKVQSALIEHTGPLLMAADESGS